MFVLCPHCQFLVTIEAASGQPPLHCPRCSGLLRPPAAVSSPPPPEPPAPAEVTQPVEVQAAGSPLEPSAPIATDVIQGAGPQATDAEATIEASPIEASSIEASPSEAQSPVDTAVLPPTPPPDDSLRAPGAAVAVDTPATMARRRWLLPAGIVALAVLLLLQVSIADRAQLAADATWRPWVSGVCGVLGCSIPAWHEPSAFTLLDRNVQADPRRPGVLHVTASFRNDARWPQAWPLLLLTLADVDGRVVGARLFAPREYLGARPTQNGLASGQSASVAMDVMEPAPRIVAFTFDFR